jgi:hypothetical protein
VQRIIMGLDKQKKTPCGFCFVVYYTRKDAEDAVKYLSGTKVDERPIRVDFDWGFVEGRQFGRGRAGGQVHPPPPLPLPKRTSFASPPPQYFPVCYSAGKVCAVLTDLAYYRKVYRVRSECFNKYPPPLAEFYYIKWLLCCFLSLLHSLVFTTGLLWKSQDAVNLLIDFQRRFV